MSLPAGCEPAFVLNKHKGQLQTWDVNAEVL